MVIQESAENYFETILVLTKKNGNVRSIDIVNELNFSKPTVSIAMKHFRENGYIVIDENGYITLTDKGMDIAKKVYERHELIAELLMYLGVDEETAYEDSCKIEHAISDKSFEIIKKKYKEMKEKQS